MASKTKKEKLPSPMVESPTWGDLHRLAEVVLAALGGSKGAADKLSPDSFYTLAILAALNLDEQKASTFIFGRQYLT